MSQPSLKNHDSQKISSEVSGLGATGYQYSTLTYVRECTGGDFVILTYYHLKSAVPFVPVANRNCK